MRWNGPNRILALAWNAGPRYPRILVTALVLAALPACMTTVEYARPGQTLAPHEGKVLVFSRIRFFYDGREFSPWGPPPFADVLFGRDEQDARHVWLRRLDATKTSWELWPDKDGSLAIWLPPGDYALVGTEGELTADAPPALSALALLRVPAGQTAVYAGELVFADEFREGWHPRYAFGSGSVTTDSVAAATADLEAKYGTLPRPPVVSAWCSGRQVPSFNYNPDFVSQSRQLLDAGCPASP